MKVPGYFYPQKIINKMRLKNFNTLERRQVAHSNKAGGTKHLIVTSP